MQKAGALGILGAVARAHAPRLKIPAIGAGGNFPPRALARQPDFQIISARRAKARIARAKDNAPPHQAQFGQHAFRAARHAFMLGIAVFGLDDGNQLHLGELMLAQHAARIAPGTAGFRTETGRKRGQAQGQIGFAEDFLCGEIGQRHFGGWDQPSAIRRAEQIFGEFRQLAGAIHGAVIHQQGHGAFGITVSLCMQVQHPLAKRAFQARERTLQHSKARPGQLRRRGEIHQAERFTQFKMLLGLKREFGRCAMLVLHHIGAFIAPIRHFRIQDIGQRFQHGILRGFGRCRFGFQRRHVIAQPHGFGFKRGGIATLAFGYADILGKRIAPGLLFLQRGLRRTPRFIMRQNARRGRGGTAPRQRRIESGRIGAQLS